MPNHFHLILKGLSEGGIAKFMQKVSTGYTMYFNKKYNRSGVLFQGGYKSKEIKTEEYLYYLTAYIHINAVEAKLTTRPDKYQYSSYGNFISREGNDFLFFDSDAFGFKGDEYKNFVKDIIDHKKDLSKIEDLLIDDK